MKSKLKFAGLYLVALGWVILLPMNALFCSAQSEFQNPLLIQQENKLKGDAETKIQLEILDKILGDGKATVLVAVEVSLESEHKQTSTSEGTIDDKKELGSPDYILPWVPAQKTITEANEIPKNAKMESAAGERSMSNVKMIVNRFDITIIHDEGIGKQDLDLVREAVVSAYSRYKNVLRIIFKSTRFAKYEITQKITQGLWDVLKPQLLLPFLIAILLLFFLFGPLSNFLKSYIRGMREKGGTEVEVDSKFEKPEEEGGGEGGAGGGGPLSPAELAAMEEEKNKYRPFYYIDEENLKRLIYLIRKEPPEVIALVVSYLKPEFVKEILTSLPPELQAKVAVHMATIKQMSEDEVKAIDQDIKEKIDFLVGGIDSLLKVLDDVDRQTRDNILEYLKNERPSLYDKIRRFILTFDDIPTIPDQAMQLIVRELKTESLARALKNASPDVTNKFFSNMSQGAVALLKEEMEYGPPLSDDQIEEERKRILDTVKGLEQSGRISIREKRRDNILEGDEMEIQTGVSIKTQRLQGGSPNSQQALEYYNAGVQMYQEGRNEEAISYLNYSIQLDPSLAQAYQCLGNALYASGNIVDAINAYEQAVNLNPSDTQLKQWLEQFKSSLTT